MEAESGIKGERGEGRREEKEGDSRNRARARFSELGTGPYIFARRTNCNGR